MKMENFYKELLRGMLKEIRRLIRAHRHEKIDTADLYILLIQICQDYEKYVK